MQPQTKTRDEHLDFVSKSVGLMLCFAWKWTATHREEDIGYVVSKRTAVRQFCGFSDDGFVQEAGLDETTWAGITQRLSGIYQQCLERHDPDAFERKGLAALCSEIEAYADRGYEKDIRPLDRSAGSLSYEEKPKVEGHPTWCVFHIANALSPRSIFADETHLPKCFLTLMEQSADRCGYDTLYTTTWLNAYPKWLTYFPEEWLANMGEPFQQVLANLGFWGQILNGRKTFNAKAGDYIRRTGELLYKPRTSHCSFAAMREHLSKWV